MIKDFVNAWNKNKDKLEEYFKNTSQVYYDDYEKVLRKLIEIVINPYLYEKNHANYETLDLNNITVIDDGDYQGTQIYIIPFKVYQPNIKEYVYTNNYYGSCSSCDTLLRISCYNIGIPTKKQVEGYMTIALHLLQKFNRLEDEKVDEE